MNVVIVLVNLLITELLLRIWARKRCLPTGFFLLSIAFLVFAYGSWRLDRFSPKPGNKKIRVGLVQPNLPLEIGIAGLIKSHGRRPHSALNMSRRIIADSPFPVDLIVWPETPIQPPCSRSGKVYDTLAAFVEETGCSLLYNCMNCAPDPEKIRDRCALGARLLKTCGDDSGLYKKRALVPYVEAFPENRWVSLIKKLVSKPGNLLRGNQSVVFQLNSQTRIIPLICYDGLFPDFIREGVNAGGEVIVIISNNRIFGKSHIGDFDFANNIFRSIEFRRPLVRVSNSGPSGIVSATGRIFDGSLTTLFKKEKRTGIVEPQRYKSIYARYKNRFMYCFWGMTGIYLIMNIALFKCFLPLRRR